MRRGAKGDSVGFCDGIRYRLASGAVVAALVGCGTSNALIGTRDATQVNGAAELPASSVFKHMASFGSQDGALPFAGLTDVKGTLYGTTELGGDSGCVSHLDETGCGTIFTLSSAGRLNAIYSFKGAPDGSFPFAPLTNVNGTLYGTTQKGGGSACASSSATPGCGVVFKVTPSGQETVLHSFAGGSDGSYPAWTPLIYVKGALYGVTEMGGPSNSGTVFKITPSGKETVLYAFTGSTYDSTPTGITYTNGAFYGPANPDCFYGSCQGFIYKLTMSGKESVLYKFKGSPDGAHPLGALATIGGDLYGTTSGGGMSGCGSTGCGTVFQLTLTGKERVLYSFDAGKDPGVTPYSGVIALHGALYGTACCGGGSVFKVTTSGDESVLHAFKGYDKDGTAPYGSLISKDNLLYGTTGFGGKTKQFKYGYGTIFSLRP